MSRAKSSTQRQREYRDRLRAKDRALLRSRDHEKYRRRCLKRKNHANISVRGIKHADRHFVDTPHHTLESMQHDNTYMSTSRRLYPIEERTYNERDGNSSMMEQCA